MYQVLARKWRPKNFTEVIGQEHVVRALSNALTQQRLHHAYLFTGTRGVGKTTIARILAKCFNCHTGVTSTPCGQCVACTEIDNGRFIDLIEVDAASRTRVEDTRDLLDNVQYLPAAGRYKVYLIDEVHMLSGHSFNALLKTLEEPPTHVKFLLATTDPQKLPVTVLSRCLQFNLKRVSPNYIQQQLSTILQAEKIIYEEAALKQIAIAADGSIRDSLSLLDQAIAYGNNTVNTTDVCNMLGAIDKTYIFQLLEALAQNNANTIFSIINDLANLAKDFRNVLDELLLHLHQIALMQFLADSTSAAQLTTNTHTIIEDEKHLATLAKIFSAEDVQLFYQIGLIGKRDLILAPTLQSGFEMIMLRMLTFLPASLTENTSSIDSESSIQSALSTTKLPLASNTHPSSQQSIPSSPSHIDVAACSSAPVTSIQPPLPATSYSMQDLLAKVNVTGPTATLLQHCAIAEISTNHLILLLDKSQAPLFNNNLNARLQKIFSDALARPMRVTVNIDNSNSLTTPAKQIKAQQEKKTNSALETLTQNPNLQKVITTFNAAIVKESVKIEQ